MVEIEGEGEVKSPSRDEICRILLENNYGHYQLWDELFGKTDERITVSWYHSSGLDLRPLLIKRVLLNWRFGKDQREDDEYREIGRDIQNSITVYSDYSSMMYNLLSRLNRFKRSGDRNGFDECLKDTVPGGGRYTFSWDYLISVEPFQIFPEKNRTYLRKNRLYDEFHRHECDGYYRDSLREYDGFKLKISWFKRFPSLYDEIYYFCLDDVLTKNLFIKNKSEVICIFENHASGEGGLSMDLILDKRKTTDNNFIQDLKYIFTDNKGFWRNQFVFYDFDIEDFMYGSLDSRENEIRVLAEEPYRQDSDIFRNSFSLIRPSKRVY